VLEACPEIGNKYAVIVNKCTNRRMTAVRGEWGQNFRRNVIERLPFVPEHVHFHRFRPELYEKDNIDQGLRDFVRDAPVVELTRGRAGYINVDRFDDECKRVAVAEDEMHKLPGVFSQMQTHDAQPWFSIKFEGMVGARIKGNWEDQGYGNRKGAIQARIAAPDGVVVGWQRVGPYPAPHDNTPFDFELPKAFFSFGNNAGFDIENASFELGYEVGGGGGHSLRISDAWCGAIRLGF